ncbi:MAG: family 3 encapsulin nanocompartment shell protein, partial [Pseudonocardiaceae bacterium]
MTTAVQRTMAEVVAERKAQQTPGRIFVEAVAAQGLEACVEYDVTITDSLTSSRRKPRYPARNMLKVVDLSREPRQCYWHESPTGDARIEGAEVRRELASRFHRSPIPELLPTTAWVQVPPDLWEDADAFQSFLDYRLIARLGTAENHTIICGEGGLLHYPGLARLTTAGPFGSTILAACNEIEQMGGTADGLIINPVDFYTFLAHGRLM